jgi:Nucleotidyl transferase AbiEii toxin, Type IV TA system
MPYETPGALRAALEARMAAPDGTTVPGLERLRRRAVFERLLVRLDHTNPGRWVLKGGMALEVRLGDRARTTRDLDLALRQAVDDAAAVRDQVIDALAEDPEADGFEFRVGPAKPLDPDEAGRPGWRFAIDARLDGRTFANVRLDVVARTEEISATDRITLHSMLAFAGFPDHQIEAVDPAQHFAEKLHAFTRPYGDRANSRVKDLPDLLLLVDQGLNPSVELLAAVDHVFAVRSTHELPVELPDPPLDWADRYATLADELGLRAGSVGEAMATLRPFWAATLAAVPWDGRSRRAHRASRARRAAAVPRGVRARRARKRRSR